MAMWPDLIDGVNIHHIIKCRHFRLKSDLFSYKKVAELFVIKLNMTLVKRGPNLARLVLR